MNCLLRVECNHVRMKWFIKCISYCGKCGVLKSLVTIHLSEEVISEEVMLYLSTHSRIVSAQMKSVKSNYRFWVNVGGLRGGGLVGMKLAS